MLWVYRLRIVGILQVISVKKKNRAFLNSPFASSNHETCGCITYFYPKPMRELAAKHVNIFN